MNGVYVLRLTAGDGQLSTNVEITVVVNANAALTNGLQAYWRFNETSGTTAADASGNNRNGTMSGATFVAGGRFGNAAQFDGVDDIMTSLRPPPPGHFLRMGQHDGRRRQHHAPHYRDAGLPYSPSSRFGRSQLSFEALRTTPSEWRTPLGSYTDNTWHHILVRMTARPRQRPRCTLMESRRP